MCAQGYRGAGEKSRCAARESHSAKKGFRETAYCETSRNGRRHFATSGAFASFRYALNVAQENFEHQLALEREKTKEAVEKVDQLRQQLKCSEQQMERKEKEILQLKKSSVPSQVAVLEQEVASCKKMHEAAQERILTLEEEKNKSALPFGNQRTYPIGTSHF